MSENCIFCKIAGKQISSQIVFENDKLFAFKDVNPQAPVHILIIPKEHMTGLTNITDYQIISEIFKAVPKIAEDQKLKTGFRVVVNSGPDAGQAVFHLHFHLIGGRKLDWPPG